MNFLVGRSQDKLKELGLPSDSYLSNQQTVPMRILLKESQQERVFAKHKTYQKSWDRQANSRESRYEAEISRRQNLQKVRHLRSNTGSFFGTRQRVSILRDTDRQN